VEIKIIKIRTVFVPVHPEFFWQETSVLIPLYRSFFLIDAASRCDEIATATAGTTPRVHFPPKFPRFVI
jgi:hypothetical protein